MVSRLKELAGVEATEKRLPQEGSFELEVGFARVRIDASFLPTADGRPSIVLHLRDVTGTVGALRAVLALQSAEGWFAYTPRVGAGDDIDRALTVFGHDPVNWWTEAKAATAAAGLAAGAGGDLDRVARTAHALVLFRAHYPEHRLLWRRAEQKALRYLQTDFGRDAQWVSEWLKQLEQSLTATAKSATAPA
jgi:hypothetical protein